MLYTRVVIIKYQIKYCNNNIAKKKKSGKFQVNDTNVGPHVPTMQYVKFSVAATNYQNGKNYLRRYCEFLWDTGYEMTLNW